MYKTNAAAKRIQDLSNFPVRTIKYGPQNWPIAIAARVLTEQYNKSY